jgi:hypothetical protein
MTNRKERQKKRSKSVRENEVKHLKMMSKANEESTARDKPINRRLSQNVPMR